MLALKPPNAIKKLRSFQGSVLNISKFIANLAQLCHPLGPLLRKPIKYTWTEEETVHFNAIKPRVANHTENTHYNLQIRTRLNVTSLVPAVEQPSNN